jgi:hypothetical protein
MLNLMILAVSSGDYGDGKYDGSGNDNDDSGDEGDVAVVVMALMAHFNTVKSSENPEDILTLI